MDKFKRKDWVKILKAINSKDCESILLLIPSFHFHLLEMKVKLSGHGIWRKS